MMTPHTIVRLEGSNLWFVKKNRRSALEMNRKPQTYHFPGISCHGKSCARKSRRGRNEIWFLTTALANDIRHVDSLEWTTHIKCPSIIWPGRMDHDVPLFASFHLRCPANQWAMTYNFISIEILVGMHRSNSIDDVINLMRPNKQFRFILFYSWLGYPFN